MPRTPVLSAAELRAVEAAHAQVVPSLMERAASAIARLCEHMAEAGTVLFVAGAGNNGGDAWVAASLLAARGRDVTVLDLGRGEPRAAEARAAREALVASGVRIMRAWPAGERFALIVDGLLGIGLDRDVDGPLAAIIATIDGLGVPVLAIDVPSGLDSESGFARGRAVRATRTLTFIAHKPGLHMNDGPDHAGTVELDDLGLGAACAAMGKGSLLAPGLVRGWLPARPRNAHKGRFGTLGVIGGSRGMVGAALLAARAGLLAGAGKVRVALVDGGIAVDPQAPELMLSSVDEALVADAIVLGPGGGPDLECIAAALALDKPLVLDADALNALARQPELRAAARSRTAPTLMTPHPGEASRLLGRATAALQADRRGAALELAAAFHAHVVLKGAGSVCASPEGAWSINTSGNPGLSSGGTGDVLAGVVGALLAQRLEPWRALQLAVCVHGAAADALVARGVGPVGLTASEVALEIRRLLNGWSA